MGIEMENGQISVAAGYDLKVPAAADYSSESAFSSITVKFDAEGDSTAALVQAEALHNRLSQATKLHVFAQLGVEFTEDENGILHPKLKATPKAAPKPKGNFKGKAAAGAAKGKGDFAPPKADKETVASLPKYVIDFGDGPDLYRDQRPLKEDGTYSQKAPDFKSVENPRDSVWLFSADGEPNDEAIAAAIEAGVEGLE